MRWKSRLIIPLNYRREILPFAYLCIYLFISIYLFRLLLRWDNGKPHTRTRTRTRMHTHTRTQHIRYNIYQRHKWALTTTLAPHTSTVLSGRMMSTMLERPRRHDISNCDMHIQVFIFKNRWICIFKLACTCKISVVRLISWQLESGEVFRKH